MTWLTAMNARNSAPGPVRARANDLGVLLGAVTGTGAGGRITLGDIEAAAARTAPPAAPAGATRQVPRAAVTDRSRASLLITRQSLWPVKARMGSGVMVSQVSVTIDVFARNPMADDLRQSNPDQYAEAVRLGGPVPTLFAVADLPAFTASGIDPNLLLRLPWDVRHAAASIADGAEVSRLFEDYGTPDETTYEAAQVYAVTHHWDEPNHAYERRVRAWASPADADRLAWEHLTSPTKEV